MSYIYSRALVEAYSPDTCLDTDASAPSKTHPTHKPFCWQDKTTARSPLSRFGMTCKPLTASHGEALLTSFVEAFRVRTLAPLGKEPESLAKNQASGEKWRGLLAKYCRDSCSWRTAQPSLIEDSEPYSETWPKWGTMQNGVAYRRERWGQITDGNESGCLATLPTPTCHNAKEGNYPAERLRKTPLLATHVGGRIHPQFTEWMMAWPIGHTDLGPLETGRFQQWLHTHSLF
jgi:hypothetical protein